MKAIAELCNPKWSYRMERCFWVGTRSNWSRPTHKWRKPTLSEEICKRRSQLEDVWVHAVPAHWVAQIGVSGFPFFMLCLYVMSDTALSLGGSREYKQSVAAKQVCMFMHTSNCLPSLMSLTFLQWRINLPHCKGFPPLQKCYLFYLKKNFKIPILKKHCSKKLTLKAR